MNFTGVKQNRKEVNIKYRLNILGKELYHLSRVGYVMGVPLKTQIFISLQYVWINILGIENLLPSLYHSLKLFPI